MKRRNPPNVETRIDILFDSSSGVTGAAVTMCSAQSLWLVRHCRSLCNLRAQKGIDSCSLDVGSERSVLAGPIAAEDVGGRCDFFNPFLFPAGRPFLVIRHASKKYPFLAANLVPGQPLPEADTSSVRCKNFPRRPDPRHQCNRRSFLRPRDFPRSLGSWI
jgi:hypothetical protein